MGGIEYILLFIIAEIKSDTRTVLFFQLFGPFIPAKFLFGVKFLEDWEQGIVARAQIRRIWKTILTYLNN